MGPKIDETLMPDVEGFILFQDFQEISRRYDVESFHVKCELLYNSDKPLSTRFSYHQDMDYQFDVNSILTVR